MRSLTALLVLFMLKVASSMECPEINTLSTTSQKKLAWVCIHVNWWTALEEWKKDIENECSIIDLEEYWRSIFDCPDFSAIKCSNQSARHEQINLFNCTTMTCEDGLYSDVNSDHLQLIWQQSLNVYKKIMSLYRNELRHCTRSCPDNNLPTVNTMDISTTAPTTDLPTTAEISISNFTDDDEDGWIVLQRRMDGSVNFHRTWSEYANGFGNMGGEFWIGLERMHQLTKDRDMILRVEMIERETKVHWYAEYSVFTVAPASDNYRVYMDGYSGNATNAFIHERNMQFTTFDNDNDANEDGNCARLQHGAWWFYGHDNGACFAANLNGLYGSTVVWYNFENTEYMLMDFSEMKVRERVLEREETTIPDVEILGDISTAVSTEAYPTSESSMQLIIDSYIMNGWAVSGKFVYKIFKERTTYATATSRCETHGGNLAAEVLRHPEAVGSIIDSGYILDWYTSWSSGAVPWIGITDLQTEGSWVWIDGGETNPNTTEWVSGEPNNAQGHEHCGQIRTHSGGKISLSDASCAASFHYMCEIDLSFQ